MNKIIITITVADPELSKDDLRAIAKEMIDDIRMDMEPYDEITFEVEKT